MSKKRSKHHLIKNTVNTLNNKDGDAHGNRQEAEVSPPTTRRFNDENSKYKNRYYKVICNMFKFFFSDPNRVIAIFTIILAIVGILALWISRDAEKRQLRAYVYVIPEITNFAIGQKPKIGVTLKNGGQTPAYNLNIGFNAEVLPYPQTGPIAGRGIQPSPTGPTKDGTGSFIYQEHTTDVSIPESQIPLIDAGTYAALIDGTKQRLYIFGRLLYMDAFQVPHHVNFCFTINGESIRNSKINYCVDYNDAD